MVILMTIKYQRELREAVKKEWDEYKYEKTKSYEP